MNKLSTSATRARDLALRRHRRALRLREVAVATGIAIGIAVGYHVGHSRDWRRADAPPLQKVEVVTYGFQDRDGVWRSYDDGERMTVIKWRP